MTTGERPLIPRWGWTISGDTEPWDGHDMNVLEAILRDHYLAGIECDHDAKTDTASCACSLVALGTYPGVGQAVQSWVDHVMAVIQGKWSMGALLRRGEAVDALPGERTS